MSYLKKYLLLGKELGYKIEEEDIIFYKQLDNFLKNGGKIENFPLEEFHLPE